MLVQRIARKTNGLAHGKSGGNGTDTQTLQMMQEAQRQSGGHGKADDIERDLDSRVGEAGDVGQLAGEQVGGDDGQAAPEASN